MANLKFFIRGYLMFSKRSYLGSTAQNVEDLKNLADNLAIDVAKNPGNSGIVIKQDQAFARESSAREALREGSNAKTKPFSASPSSRRCGI